MRAGKLDRQISVERETETVAPSGAVSSNWTPIASMRAEIVRQTATEFLAGYGEAETGTVIFRIRYRAGIATADRIRFDGEAFDIKEIVEIGRHRALELRAEAVR